LSEIASVEQRTRETLVYANSSARVLMWGVLVAFGYVFGYFQPTHSGAAWIAIMICGFAGSFIIRYLRAGSERDTRLSRGLTYAQFVIVGYGAILIMLLWPVGTRQMAAFWPTLIMLGFVLAGLWLGRFFILCGLAVTALTVVGYFWSGDWFWPWMAVVNGGGLIAAGLWLRRMG
jgi:hypothetical protein